MSDSVILDFCANCGQLLHSDTANEEERTCDNCGEAVEAPEMRAQGTFTREQADKLHRAAFGEGL